jgi:hypothetical protein
MAGTRDEFTEKTKHVIASRVGYRCSRPDCQVLTCGPCSDTQSFYNIGVASHITAASEGFTRYDKNLTSEQRKHPDNGIWMCQSHGKEIDDDEVQYPVDLLVQWKQDAEDRAKSMLGKAPETAGGQTPIVALSNAERYGLGTMASLADGSELPHASIFDLVTDDLVFFASGTFILRFLIAKKMGAPQITLYQMVATVYETKPLPPFRSRSYALPQQVYPFFLTLEPPIDGKPRPCPAKYYCRPGDGKPVHAAPLTITEDCPEVIDVRFTATESGIYEFALDAIVMVGMQRHTFRVFNREAVLFEKHIPPDELEAVS